MKLKESLLCVIRIFTDYEKTLCVVIITCNHFSTDKFCLIKADRSSKQVFKKSKAQSYS